MHVFLSHNRKQKAWVRALYQFLTRYGVSVFFDEASIAPGDNIIDSIQRAIADCERIVLILSRQSLGSRWVNLEAQLAFHRDTDDGMQTVLPVLIDEFPQGGLPLTLRMLSHLDLCPLSTREAMLRQLFAFCGVPNSATLSSSQFRSLLNLTLEDEPAVRVGGIEDVYAWNWSGVQLLERLIELDYSIIAGLDDAHEGQPAQWAPVFMNHPDTWRLLIDANESIVGYWHFAPLQPDAYSQAKAGLLLDSNITVDRLDVMDYEGHYNIYIVSVGVHERFRTRRNKRLLTESFFEAFDRLAKDGIFIDEVTANAYAPEGIALCRSFDMTHVGDHADKGRIFVTTFRRMLHNPIARQFPDLLRLYEFEHGKS